MATVYIRKSRLTFRQQDRLIEYFVASTTARAAGELIAIQSNTAIKFFVGLRKLIAGKLPSYDLSGEIEAEESYFGGVRKGKRGKGLVAKFTQPLFPMQKQKSCQQSSKKKQLKYWYKNTKH
ncbi:MAG: hypothetical protein KC505_08190 [Myxococcales bacterium]|nr:hypothetical protein [Myxococcales bacterium]USN50726.1 MAG: hypothetical protein H6731_10790 [Myxococcales bacterium]